jgi:hypothetical protein
MNFEATGDLAAFLDALDGIAARFTDAGPWQHGEARHQFSQPLDSMLEEGGYFACVQEESLGVLAAASMVMVMSRLPVCTELAASALVAPLLSSAAGMELPRPLAVAWGHATRPVRYLPQARTLLVIDGDLLRIASIHPEQVQSVASAFAYPMGVLRDPATLRWITVEGVSMGAVRERWRIGVAAELVGCLHAGLQAVVAHVRDRRQFGRPLGAFQAIQHRLAQVAVQVEAARWLTLQAAFSGTEADAAAAAGHAQQCTPTVVYDLHQFMGAMGLTLEHPLHRWTTRAKMLRADLGGAQAQYGSAPSRTETRRESHEGALRCPSGPSWHRGVRGAPEAGAA